jgi:hypothetical protein
MNFDNRGYLQPEGLIETTMEAFIATFVGENPRRRSIFEQYRAYNNDLRELLSVPFTQWIDGGFVTQKETPNDIDFVTLLDSTIYTQHEAAIEARFSKWQAKHFYPDLDAYIVRTYVEGHKNHVIGEMDKMYWRDWFSRSKPNRAGKKFSKGFIQINIL